MLLQTLVQLHILISAAPALAGWAACWHVAPVLPAQTVRVAYYNQAVPATRVRAVRGTSRASAHQPASDTPQAACATQSGTGMTRVANAPVTSLTAGILPHAPRAP